MHYFNHFPAMILILLLANPCPAAEVKAEKSEEPAAIVETVHVVGHVPLNRAAQTITVHDREALENPGLRGLKDLMNRTPGFLVLNGGHYGQSAYAFARGAAVNQTLFIIDGVKVSDPSSALGLNLTAIPAQLLERVEIVRGPMAGRYGSNAMGGVVSLTTRRDDGVVITAGLGSRGSLEAGIHAARVSGNWHLALNANLIGFNERMENDEFLNRGITARAIYLGQNLKTGIQVFIHSASSGIPLYMGLASPRREYDQASVAAALPFTWMISENAEFKLCFSHNTNVYEFRDPDDNWGPYYKNRSRVNEIEASVSGHFISGWDFRVGLDASSHSIFNLSGDITQLNNESGGFFSGYAGTDADLGRVMLTAAMRLDKYHDVPAAWSPQIGVSWLVTDQLKLRASWAKSFRAPTLPERLNPAWGNPELKPEFSRSMEAGIEVYGKTLTLGVTGFITHYRNLIGFSPLTVKYANLNQAKIRGLEINLTMHPAEKLEIRTAWTWMHTNDLQYNRRLLRRPEHAVCVGVTWNHARFTLGGEMIYVGRRLDYNELDWIFPVVEVPPFNTFSFHASLPLSGKLFLQARMTNAFNTDYAEVYGYPAPGTRFMAGLRFQTD